MEKELRLSEQLASELTIKNIHTLIKLTGSHNLNEQQAYSIGYIDRDITELMKEDGKIQELINKLTKHTQTDEEQDEALASVYELFNIAYKAGFKCGCELG